MAATQDVLDQQVVREKVRAGYAAIAQAEPTTGSSCSSGSCCGASDAAGALALAETVGYSIEELKALPEGANMGLSCGNPVALAGLRPGEVVVDLGSGGGFDVFLAGPRVGATGRAIGVDMTPEMLAKARRNIAPYRTHTGLDNVEFRLGEIEALPLPDETADVVISNCVLNLSPDKPRVWGEIARVLRPGGRVAVSDLALKRPLPPAVAQMVEALVGCIAGAVLVSDTERMARAAGLVDIVLEEKDIYIETMTEWNDPLYARIIESLPAGTKVSDYVTSLGITARKPAEGEACCGTGCC